MPAQVDDLHGRRIRLPNPGVRQASGRSTGSRTPGAMSPSGRSTKASLQLRPRNAQMPRAVDDESSNSTMSISSVRSRNAARRGGGRGDFRARAATHRARPDRDRYRSTPAALRKSGTVETDRAATRYTGETTTSPKRARNASIAARRCASGSMLQPRLRYARCTLRSQTFDPRSMTHADRARTAHRAGLATASAAPTARRIPRGSARRSARPVFRPGRSPTPTTNAIRRLRHRLVVERVLDRVARRRLAVVEGHLDVERNRLADAAFPVVDADQGVDLGGLR